MQRNALFLNHQQVNDSHTDRLTDRQRWRVRVLTTEDCLEGGNGSSNGGRVWLEGCKAWISQVLEIWKGRESLHPPSLNLNSLLLQLICFIWNWWWLLPWSWGCSCSCKGEIFILFSLLRIYFPPDLSVTLSLSLTVNLWFDITSPSKIPNYCGQSHLRWIGHDYTDLSQWAHVVFPKHALFWTHEADDSYHIRTVVVNVRKGCHLRY